MNVLVTGAGGMLGAEVCAELAARGHVLIATGRSDGLLPLDISDPRACREAFAAHRPDAVVHCAAWTDVDGAERDPDGAYRVNALGSLHVAAAAAEAGAWMAAVSTDFVFDGQKVAPYTEFDAVNPLGAYGASKEAGERLVRQTLPHRHMVVRTSWLYGPRGKNFVRTMLRLTAERPEVTVVADQVGCPTYAPDLARKLADLLEDPLPGTYHVCNAGETTWYAFAREIAARAGRPGRVLPITAAEYATRYGSPTRRPAHSPLRRYMLEMRGMDDLPSWQNSLARCLQYLGEAS